MFCEAILPTPILSNPDFSRIFREFPLDSRGHLRELEMIALPKTIFHVKKRYPTGIYEIQTDIYPIDKKLFIDHRFVQEINKRSFANKMLLPSVVLQKRLLGLEGVPYLWGGNYSNGIPQMHSFYPPERELTPKEKITWSCKGVDCSGLLYQVTEGLLPRNASWIAKIGYPLVLKKESTMLSKVLPLDVIVYREEMGHHLIIILDEKHCIESREKNGVVITDLFSRLEEITQSKRYVYEGEGLMCNTFTIRRWYP